MSNEDVKAGDTWEWVTQPPGRAPIVGGKVEVTEVGEHGFVTGRHRDAGSFSGGIAATSAHELTTHARRLPREAASVEERRAALKVGEVIKDPVLLAKGMRVRKHYDLPDHLYEDVTIAKVDDDRIETANGCHFRRDSLTMDRGVTFLGWAQEEKAIRAGDAVAMGPDGKLRKAGYIPAVKLDHRICNAEQCGFHHDPSDPACVRARHRTPPRALPFKRHPGCYMPSIHVVEVMCMGCEAAIAREAVDNDRNAAHARALQVQPRPPGPAPSPSGLGGTVGPVLSRLR